MVGSFNPNVGAATFQVVFYEANHGIDFVYQDVDFGDSAYNNGASATVGIQYDSSNYLQISSNTNALAAGRAICFRNPDTGGERCTEATDMAYFTDTEGCSGVVSWLGEPRMDVTGALGATGGYGGPAPTCWSGANEPAAQNDVWHQWTNNTGAPVYVRVTTDTLANGNQSAGNSQIGVWDNCVSNQGSSQLYCAENGGDAGSGLLAPSNLDTNISVTTGNTIYFQFDGNNTNTAFDTFAFACTPQASISTPPAHDACANGLWVVNTPYTHSNIDMSGATVLSSDPKATCMYNSGEQRGGATVWYSYIPSANGTVTASCQGFRPDRLRDLRLHGKLRRCDDPGGLRRRQ